MQGHAGVLECAVIGWPHPEWGEAAAAYVVTDGPIIEEQRAAHLKEQIASFKVPRRYEVVDSLPRNALGKVQKHLLPDR